MKRFAVVLLVLLVLAAPTFAQSNQLYLPQVSAASPGQQVLPAGRIVDYGTAPMVGLPDTSGVVVVYFAQPHTPAPVIVVSWDTNADAFTSVDVQSYTDHAVFTWITNGVTVAQGQIHWVAVGPP